MKHYNRDKVNHVTGFPELYPLCDYYRVIVTTSQEMREGKIVFLQGYNWMINCTLKNQDVPHH